MAPSHQLTVKINSFYKKLARRTSQPQTRPPAPGQGNYNQSHPTFQQNSHAGGFHQPPQEQPFAQSGAPLYTNPPPGNFQRTITGPGYIQNPGPNQFRSVAYQTTNSQHNPYGTPTPRGIPSPDTTESFRQPVSIGGFQPTPPRGNSPQLTRKTLPEHATNPMQKHPAMKYGKSNMYDPNNAQQIPYQEVDNMPRSYKPENGVGAGQFNTHSMIKATNESPYYQNQASMGEIGNGSGDQGVGNMYSHYQQPLTSKHQRNYSDEIWDGINKGFSNIDDSKGHR